jgi:hypothetical protein
MPRTADRQPTPAGFVAAFILDRPVADDSHNQRLGELAAATFGHGARHVVIAAEGAVDPARWPHIGVPAFIEEPQRAIEGAGFARHYAAADNGLTLLPPAFGRAGIVEALRELAHSGAPAGARALSDALEAIGGPAPDAIFLFGGERSLYGAFTWSAAYAELILVDVTWTEFSAAELARAMEEFSGRDRRFGRVTSSGAK